MEGASIHAIDYVVAGVILLSTLFAFIRGFIGSFLSLFGWVASIYLTYLTFPLASILFEGWISNKLVEMIVGHTLLLLGFLILFGIVNLLASTAVKGLTRGMIDRALGACFGVLRGIIIVSFIFFIMSASFLAFTGNADINSDKKAQDSILPKWLTQSLSYPLLKQGAAIMNELIPESFYTRFQDMYSSISDKSPKEIFIENEIKKLEKNLSPQQLKKIQEQLDEESLALSNDEVQHRKLQKMMEIYHNMDEGSEVKYPLTNEEIKKIQKVLSQKNIEKAKATTEAE